MDREGTLEVGHKKKKKGGDDWAFLFGFVPRRSVVALTPAQLQIS